MANIVNATTTATGAVVSTIGSFGGLFESTPILSLVLGVSLLGIAVGILLRFISTVKA